jgi:hypothetical protein
MRRYSLCAIPLKGCPDIFRVIVCKTRKIIPPQPCCKVRPARSPAPLPLSLSLSLSLCLSLSLSFSLSLCPYLLAKPPVGPSRLRPADPHHQAVLLLTQPSASLPAVCACVRVSCFSSRSRPRQLQCTDSCCCCRLRVESCYA